MLFYVIENDIYKKKISMKVVCGKYDVSWGLAFVWGLGVWTIGNYK